MTRRRSASALAIAALLCPAAAWAQALPGEDQAPAAVAIAEGPGEMKIFLVMNNTKQKLTCTYRWPEGKWKPWFKLAKAANWQGAGKSDEAYFQCRPPVAQFRFTLRPGTRYSLLRNDEGGIDLVQVTANEGSR